jgi:hypothetical protein
MEKNFAKLPLGRFLIHCHGLENKPLSLGLMLRPFGINVEIQADEDLLVGHFVDYLGETYAEDDDICPWDLLAVAYELGCVGLPEAYISVVSSEKFFANTVA